MVAEGYVRRLMRLFSSESFLYMRNQHRSLSSRALLFSFLVPTDLSKSAQYLLWRSPRRALDQDARFGQIRMVEAARESLPRDNIK